MSDSLSLAGDMVADALKQGADEASVSVAEGTSATLIRRDGKVEQATRATSRGLGLSVLADGRFSHHATSDLRPEALHQFLERALSATRFIEQDPDRRQPDPDLCGRGVSEAQLDQCDPAWDDRSDEDRAEHALALEQRLEALAPEQRISGAVYVSDGQSSSARVMSNGFSGEHGGAWFTAGGELTLSDGERRPEATAWYGSIYFDDLPGVDDIATEIVSRARERMGARAMESGTYPMLLANRAAGRILGVLGSPLSGGSLHEGQSCLAGRLDTKIGSGLFTLIDDPTIGRGLGSRPWDGDALVARPRTIVDGGWLRSYYVNVYYGRKLDMAPTTGGRSNWVVPPGDRSVRDLTADLPRAILVHSFLGGNSNGVTGDFSFGIRGVLLEHGEPTRSLSEMNVSGNVLDVFDRLVGIADDPWTYSSVRSPSLLFDEIQFSGT